MPITHISTQSNHHPPAPPIAVVGVGALFPGAAETSGFWHNVLEGRDQIRDIPPEHWLIDDYFDPDPTVPDKTYGKRGAFLDHVAFDSMAHGVPPTTIQQTDTSQLLGMEVAQRVLDDAADGSFPHIDKSRVSVILGATGTTELVVHLGSRLQRPIWLRALRENGIAEDEAQTICNQIADSYVPWTEASFPGLLGNVIAGRIANRFDLGGTNCVVDAACASSLSAMEMGLNELYLGQSDMVITGGVDTLNDILMYMCFSKTPALSPTGDCRPFAEEADGTILGEGVGLVALRRLEDAERDGDKVYAVIRGLGSSSDGTGTAIYAPKSSGQAQALKRAYQAAGYSPRTVELLEAHGTATKAGDAAEFQGASSVFAEEAPNSTQWCAIGSIKSQIGHTKGAAGAASLIKAALALHHKVLPPTIKVDRPNPKLDIASSPFYINTEARPWVRDDDHPRRASVSSFGFGGSNFHVALEEYTGSSQPKERYRPSPTQLFLLDANSVARLLEQSASLTNGFDHSDNSANGFQYLARETQRNFQADSSYRLALVAKDFADLEKKLLAAAAAIEQNPNRTQQSPLGWYYTGSHNSDGNSDSGDNDDGGKLAFLFPGQGSQYVAMGADLALAFPEVQQVWDDAAALSVDASFLAANKLHELVFPIPVYSDEERAAQEGALRMTERAQPAIGITSLACLSLLRKLGIEPHCVGGHSFGEVTALHAAGALDKDAFLNIAQERGRLMAEAAATVPGAMTAVFHDAAKLTQQIEKWDVAVVIANHNSPQQVVISGECFAVEAAETKLQQQGIRYQRLPVSTAFHSSVVSDATAPFQHFLESVQLSPPTIPTYANSTAQPYPASADECRATLANQIVQPVRFAEQIEAMYASGVRTFVEVGPGTILSKLVATILGDRPHQAISLDHKEQHGLTTLWHAIAQLAVVGVPMQLAELWEGVACGDDPRTRVAPKLAINISGVNYNKPYPPKEGTSALPAPNPSTVPVEAASIAAASTAAASIEQDQPLQTGPSSGHHSQNGHEAMTPTAHNNGSSMQSAEQPSQRTTRPETAAPNGHTPIVPNTSGDMNIAPPVPQFTNGVEAGNGQAANLPTNGASFPANQPAHVSTQIQSARPVSQADQPQTLPMVHSSEALQWVGAFQELQRQTVDAHMAFLHVAEQSMKSLEAMLTAQSHPVPQAHSAEILPRANGTASQVEPPVLFQPAPITPSLPAVPASTAPYEIPAQPAVTTAPSSLEPVQTANTAVPTISQPPAPSPQPPAPSYQPPAIDLHGTMLEVVSEKTGYPTEMLEPTMSLSADLGIDSIKRVEILAAMRERVPTLPEFDPTEMAPLNTLDEIVVYMDAKVGPANQSANQPPATSHHPPANDLHGTMLEVVSEKTGYPTEMLEPAMSLSADLGIDSIKRVEILAAMRERVPALPEFDPTEMAPLNTLDEIVAYMDAKVGPASQSANQPLATSHHSPANDLHGTMLEVVSEKTGYPTEMLEPAMSLSADLGIDSIKRVEILAAMRERVPTLPEFDPTEMAPLNTLDEIVTYMDAKLGGAIQGASPTGEALRAEASHTVASTADEQLGRYTLDTDERPVSGLTPPF